ncbi:MAG TPA: hypothetical protein VEI46_00915 [Thermodesulfovibrionales bacterium]|nr:hypothetical protein [Thermodesulfovibrionales bacterium]
MEPTDNNACGLPGREKKNQKGTKTAAETTIPVAASFIENLRRTVSRKRDGTTRRQRGIRYLRKEREKA